MKTGQVIAVVVVIGISCLALGAALGYAIHSGETVTSTSNRTATSTATMTSFAIANGSITEIVIVSPAENMTAYECGTNVFVGGTAIAYESTTTEFVFSTASQGRLPNTSLTTESSTGSWVSRTVTTVTQKSTIEGTYTSCTTIV